MQDLMLVVLVLCVCAVVGYPACLLLPENHFRARFVAAPTVGLSILCAATVVFYILGLSPRVTLLALFVVGAFAIAFQVLTSGLKISVEEIWVFTAVIVVSLMCLMPAWIGGAQFKVFQGNGMDQINVYLPGSATFHRYDYQSVISANAVAGSNPIVIGAQFALKRPISVLHSAFADMTHNTTMASAYAFTLALQLVMFFSALFVGLQIFSARAGVAVFMAGALTVGFFEQYALDINSWLQLSCQPIFVLALAVTVLAFESNRFGTRPLEAFMRLSVFFGLLLSGAMVVYPDGCSVFAIAGIAAAGFGLLARKARGNYATALSGLGLGAASALLLSYWVGTLTFAVQTQIFGQALRSLDWWRYFDRYLLGRSENHIEVLAGNPNGWRLVRALFEFPIDAVVSGLGLFWFLPRSSGIPGLSWRLALYAFVVLLFVGATRHALASWRANPAGAESRMLAGCVASCILPITFLLSQRYWTAGKALSMASPLITLFLVGPLLSGVKQQLLERTAMVALLASHLMTGALRTFLVMNSDQQSLAGLPNGMEPMDVAKRGFDWRMERLAEEMRSCGGVIIDVKNLYMNKMAQMVATDIGARWASIQPVDYGYRISPPFMPDGWQSAECIASDEASEYHSGRNVIWLISDRSTFEFLDKPTGSLEIGVSGHPGVTVIGGHDLEVFHGRRLRWTAGDTRFQVPNSPDFPASRLDLKLWPFRNFADVRVQISVNDQIVYEGPVSEQTLEIPLNRWASTQSLTISLVTTPVMHAPQDNRDLGVPIRELRVWKAP